MVITVTSHNLLPWIIWVSVDSSSKEVMFQRRLPFAQLAIATLLGVLGGVYIYRPYFAPLPETSVQQNQDVPKKQKETD
ncbi:protein PIGBOS1 [Odontesthes bonariensis]|uniref:protein PIGBOS1 n=1 Tax=Odontesthes bonariensis TaxID=219752 RepID=UPI003F5821F2